jgi:hopanoid biosynthesis associated RND transporter like protein HpnN
MLAALVAAVCNHPRLVLAVSLGLCGLSAVAACTRLEYHTSRNDLVSAGKDYQRRWQKYLAEFGDDDDIVFAVQGDNPARLRAAVEAMADRLRARPEQFDRLFYKVDLRHLRDRALLLLPEAELRAIAEGVADMKRLLDAGPIGWSALGLGSLTREALARCAVAAGASPSAGDERFSRQFAAACRAACATLRDPAEYRNPWGDLMRRPPGEKDLLAQPQYFTNADGTFAFLLVRPIKEAGSFTQAQQSVEAARLAVEEVRAEFPDLVMGLTGLPVLETDEMVAAQTDTRLASYLAIAGVALLFVVVYRGIAYPALTVLTLLTGTLWALGWTTLTVGHLNILSATFAVMLIGMGDYGVLWVMRYEHARRGGMGVPEALLHTTEHVAVGNLTAAWTLALAFFAAMLADFKAVAELGWIAGCGVLLCALACFTVLPALLMLFDRRGRLDGGLRLYDPAARRTGVPPVLGGETWLPTLARRPRLVLGVGLAVAAVVAACAMQVKYDHNLLHLQAQSLESVRWETALIENTAGASWHALSIADTAEQALALKARYEKLPGISRVAEVASLVPPDQERKLPVVRSIHDLLRHLPRRGARIPQVPKTADHVELLQALLEELDVQLELVLGSYKGEAALVCREARQAAAALRRQVAGLPGRQAAARLEVFDQRLVADLAEGLHRLREVATPRYITLADVPAPLRERHVSPNGQWLVRAFAREGLWDFGPLEKFTDEVRGVDPEATGKPFTTVEGLKAMKGGLERAGLYAFLVIVLVLWLDFRTLGGTLVALTPLVLGVLLSVGVLGLLGRPLNPANMIAFPLILGVGVDNGVHILHDHLIRRRDGRAGVSRAIGRGVLIKALTTMIGFGTLMISTERGLAGLGFILTLGVGCSMLSALVLLPAALAWWERRRPAFDRARPLRGGAEEVQRAA